MLGCFVSGMFGRGGAYACSKSKFGEEARKWKLTFTLSACDAVHVTSFFI